MHRSHLSRSAVSLGPRCTSTTKTYSRKQRPPVIDIYAQATDESTIVVDDDLPSIIVEDFSMNTNNTSVLYSGRVSLGRRSVISVVGTPRRCRDIRSGLGGSPASPWLNEQTLIATPHIKPQSSISKKVTFSTPLDQYPKSPPVGFAQSSSARSLDSVVQALQLTGTVPLAEPLPDGSPRAKEVEDPFRADGPTENHSSYLRSEEHQTSPPVNKSGQSPAVRKLRKRVRSQNLRDLYTQAPNTATEIKYQHMSITSEPAYSFEYQLTLAILDALSSSPKKRKLADGQDVDKKPKLLTITASQRLGGLRRRLGLSGGAFV